MKIKVNARSTPREILSAVDEAMAVSIPDLEPGDRNDSHPGRHKTRRPVVTLAQGEARARQIRALRPVGKGAKMCVQCKGQLTIGDTDYCRWHGEGRKVWKARQAANPKKPTQAQAVASALKAIQARGLMPHALQKLPLFVDLMNAVQAERDIVLGKGRTPRERAEAVGRMRAMRAVALGMVRGWLKTEVDGDASAWVAAVQQARSLGFGGR